MKLRMIITLMVMAVVPFLGQATQSAASLGTAQAMAGTHHHPPSHSHSVTTQVAPPLAAAQTASCTQGHLDYGIGSLTVSADWEPPGSCGWHLRTCALGADGKTLCGGFVKATEVVTTNKPVFGHMSDAWLQQYFSTAQPQRWCWDVVGQVSTQWHKCSGTGNLHNTPVSATLTAKAALLNESGHLKESFGAGYYVGTGSLNYGSTVSEEFGGRQMTFNIDGTWCDSGGFCFTRGTLVFTSGSNTCAQGSGTSVFVAHCTGDFGIEWGREVINGHDHFINTHSSAGAGAHIYMGGLQNGGPLTLGRAGVPSGVLQAWDFL